MEVLRRAHVVLPQLLLPLALPSLHFRREVLLNFPLYYLLHSLQCCPDLLRFQLLPLPCALQSRVPLRLRPRHLRLAQQNHVLRGAQLL